MSEPPHEIGVTGGRESSLMFDCAGMSSAVLSGGGSARTASLDVPFPVSLVSTRNGPSPPRTLTFTPESTEAPYSRAVAVVLIGLPGGEGMIRGDDGEIMLTHDVKLERGQPLQPWDRYQPIHLGLSHERMLFGGLLPPGAVSVEAVAATGVRKLAAVAGGSYAVIFEDREHGEPALGYRDAAGAFVHRPMPADYPHHPVTDAEEPCPVCGAIQYEEYFPTEDWRGGRGGGRDHPLRTV